MTTGSPAGVKSIQARAMLGVVVEVRSRRVSPGSRWKRILPSLTRGVPPRPGREGSMKSAEVKGVVSAISRSMGWSV